MSGRRKKIPEDIKPEEISDTQTEFYAAGGKEVSKDEFAEAVFATAQEPDVTPEVEETKVNEEPEVVETPAVAEESASEPAAKPQTAHDIAQSIRAEIRAALSAAPKRNDATTMPTIVNLRCKTGDFHFMMPQFDAATVQRLWDRYKDTVEPEQFVSYLYTTMGLNPPKLYMFMNIVNIA